MCISEFPDAFPTENCVLSLSSLSHPLPTLHCISFPISVFSRPRNSSNSSWQQKREIKHFFALNNLLSRMIHLSLSSRVIYHFISLPIPFSWNKVQTIYHHKIKPVNTKGTQPWIFIGRTDAEAPILWPHDAKSWLIGNDPNAGKKLRAGGEGADKGWDGWMASPTQWTWIWANSWR